MVNLARQALSYLGGNSAPQARRFYLYLALLAMVALFFSVPWFRAESSPIQQGIG